VRHRSAAITALVASSLLLTACNSNSISNTVIVTYHKAGVCSAFQENPGTTPQQTQTAGEGLFVVYIVDSIANTASGATDFTFDTSKVYVNGGSSLPGQPFSNHFTLSSKLVSEGVTATSPGWFALNVQGARQDDSDFLLYHSGPGESMILENRNSNNNVINEGMCTPDTVP
jgi:hypothetical protein